MGATLEIALEQLHAGDQIVIQARYGAYIFRVIGPPQRLGLLVGGVFGNYAVQAVLEMLPVETDHLLRAGGRALFHVESSADPRLVPTSVITHPIHRRRPQTD